MDDFLSNFQKLELKPEFSVFTGQAFVSGTTGERLTLDDIVTKFLDAYQKIEDHETETPNILRAIKKIEHLSSLEEKEAENAGSLGKASLFFQNIFRQKNAGRLEKIKAFHPRN